MMQELKREPIDGWWGELKQNKLMFALFGLLLFSLVGVGGWKLRSWYLERKESAGQEAFSQALHEYHTAVYNAMSGKTEAKQWDDTQLIFQDVSQKYAGTAYGKFARVFQADVLAREGKIDQAVNLLEEALKDIDSKTPGYYLFATKIALLQFDAGNTEDALERLTKLSQDTTNPDKDMATFFLGYHYWAKEDYARVLELWDGFKESNQSQDANKVSQWALLAQVKLAQIS